MSYSIAETVLSFEFTALYFRKEQNVLVFKNDLFNEKQSFHLLKLKYFTSNAPGDYKF